MGRFKEQMDKAAQQTDEELKSQISNLSKLTDEQIKLIAPEKADREKLAKLLSIVKAETDENEKITQITNNIENVAGTIVKVLKFLV